MTTFFDRFGVEWASAGPQDDFTLPQIATGWDVIGAGPPTVEQFNSLQAQDDQKDNWLFGQIREVILDASLVPSADALTTLRDAIRFLVNRNSLVGEVKAFAGGYAPNGYVFCDGRALSRTTYAALYAVIGNVYGSGNGSTTFNVPDSRGRALIGADAMGSGSRANRLTNLSGSTGLLGAFGGHQLLQAHDHNFSQTPHTHTISIDEAGVHRHNGNTDPNGYHSHSGSTTTNGLHRHQDGREALYNGQGGGIPLGQGNFSYTATQFPKFQNADTSANGDHAHGLYIDPSGTHIHGYQTDDQGSHVHTISLAAATAGITFQASGDGNAQNMIPFITVNNIIFTGVFA